MNRNEFNAKIENYGICLKDLLINNGEKVLIPFTLGIYKDKSEWIVYNVDERSNYFEYFRGNEEDAFAFLFKNISGRLRFNNFVTREISKEIIFTEKDKIFCFFRSEFDMNDYECYQTWDYLKQDFHVLNEVKYYALKSDFVPEENSYKVEGYSAKQLYENTYLDVLGAFNYLIYLKRNPKEALAELKAGLPRK